MNLDPAAGTIDFSGHILELRDLRHLEVERGFLNLGTETRWETIDLYRWRSGAAPLTSGRALSPAGVQFIEALKDAIGRNRDAARLLAEASAAAEGLPAPGALPLPPPESQKFDFRFLVRIDRLAIILTIVSVGLIFLDLYRADEELPISFPGSWWFLLLILLGTGALYLKRGVARLHFDARGITRKGLFRSRSYPWDRVREYRRQHAEMEIVGQGFRLGVNLEILAAGGTPLVLRRGRIAMLSLPGRLFLGWLPGRAREVEEPAVELTPGEKTRNRLWIGALVALNTAVFLAEKPFSPEVVFDKRLVEMGARTADSMRESWRLLTALFLHGSTFHLITNMLALAVLGPWIGWIFGWWRGVGLYLASGVLGNLIAQLLPPLLARGSGSDGAKVGPSVGASTAILGLLGALLAVTYRRPERIPLAARARFRWAIPVTFLLTLGLGLVIRVLDNGAHLGGFVAGLALAWWLPPRRL